MDFELSEEQRLFQDQVRQIAEKNFAKGALQRCHSPKFPYEVARVLAAHGLMGITIPEADGGQGGTLMDAVLAIEQVALVDPRGADAVQVGNFGAIRTLSEYGSAEQKAKYLPSLIKGEKVLGLGMSEPEAGSAVTELTTKAVADGKGFRVSGTKVFGSHSVEADIFLVYLRFGPGIDGIGSVILERGMDGFTFGQPTAYMNGEEWCTLYMDNVYVPPQNVLLGPGGFKRQIAGFNAERIGNTSRSLALGRFAYNAAREHAKVRKQFGRPLCEFQGLQWKFAEMAVNLEAAQLLLYRAATRADRGLPSAQDTSLAKYMCNKVGFELANEAVQIMGGAGYSQDSLVEYCFRKTRGWLIAGGSAEMMKNRIAEGVFERSFSQRMPKSGPKPDRAGESKAGAGTS